MTAPVHGVPRTSLGARGIPATRIGLGLAALGRPGYLTIGHGEALGEDRSIAAMERHAHAVLDAAYAAGVRSFDAARSYGRAEAFLASWIGRRGFAPRDITVSSKWGYTYTANWEVDADPPEVKDLSVDAFRRQLAETRELLGEHLDLYQIHSATLESGVLEDAALDRELQALRDSGVAVGLSVTGPAQAATIDRAVGRGGFDTVQATFNALDPSAGPALESAHAAGLGVMVKEALANGRLTDLGDQPALLERARARGVGADALALAFVLAQPWADVVLSGAADEAQLASNLRALELELEPADLAALDGLAIDPDAYWTQRAAMPWN